MSTLTRLYLGLVFFGDQSVLGPKPTTACCYETNYKHPETYCRFEFFQEPLLYLVIVSKASIYQIHVMHSFCFGRFLWKEILRITDGPEVRGTQIVGRSKRITRFIVDNVYTVSLLFTKGRK